MLASILRLHLHKEASSPELPTPVARLGDFPLSAWATFGSIVQKKKYVCGQVDKIWADTLHC